MLNRFGSVLLAVTALASAAQAAPEIPVEDFFKRPQFSNFQLSPSGEYLAAMTPINNRRNIAVIDLATREATVVTSQRDQDVSYFLWASDERLLFGMDDDGNESYGIFAVNRDGTEPRVLIPPAASQIEGGSFVIRAAFPINRLKHDPEHVLVSAPRIVQSRYAISDVQRLNIFSGRLSPVERNPGYILGYMADDEGVVYGALEHRDLTWRFLYRGDADAPWEALIEFRTGEPGFHNLWVNRDRDRAYVASNLQPDGRPRDKAAVYRYDIARREIGELVFEHREVDVTQFMISELRDDVFGLHVNAMRPDYHFLDPQWDLVQQAVQAAFPDKICSIVSFSEDERLAVYRIWDSTDLGTYYLLDRDTNRLEELAIMAEWLDPEALAPMRAVTIEARDGLSLPGYLTLPIDDEGSDLPLIVNPHGGPRARDSYTFNPYVQLLANRGYAVLQVNFRGSTGYGMAFDQAGWRQWGRAMQDDVTDAVRWAVEEGIADPQRICIFGGSYGGYAAMAGLAFTPELYRCGVNYVGVTSLPHLFRFRPTNWEYFFDADQRLEIGDPDAEAERLEALSPVNHAEKIRVPVLMAYGRQDPRVALRHALDMERELKRHDVPYRLIIKPREGHGFAKFENQVEFYSEVVAFFDEHLK